MFKGRFGDWSFRPASRAAARAPLIVMLPRGLGHPQLAPMQFLRLRNDTTRRVDTLYADIDLIHADRIDDNDQTFLADFYISMNDRNAHRSTRSILPMPILSRVRTTAESPFAPFTTAVKATPTRIT